MKYVKPERVVLRGNAEYTERWVQERIAEDPSILGLGDLVLKDKERLHPQAGRLDILCQDQDSSRRYEIEIQLGRHLTSRTSLEQSNTGILSANATLSMTMWL